VVLAARFAEARAEVEAHGAGRERRVAARAPGLGRARRRSRAPRASGFRERWKGFTGSLRAIREVLPVRPPTEIADFLAGYVAAGARDFNVMAVSGSAEQAIDGVAEIRAQLTQSA
jgi:hypothetical protein